jgi:hypothetical protein
MPTVKAPTYSKAPHPKTGAPEPCYTFHIEFTADEPVIVFVADHAADVSLQTLQKHVVEQLVWWNTFMTYFLQATAKNFSKPYTVEQINKITKHALVVTDTSTTTEFPVHVSCTPVSIQISGGVFLVQWNATYAPIVIDIPVADDTTDPPIMIPDMETAVSDELEELNIGDVPLDENTTELELDTPTKFYDKQKVKEARLKAKLAMYKAQHQMSTYYEKYGQDLSDSETSDEESSDEDVQL